MIRNIKTIASALTLITLGAAGIAKADAPVGPYVLIGGGGAWISDSKLADTNIKLTRIDAFTTRYSISYKRSNAFDYTGRAAFGYLFPIDCDTQSVGFEAAYNYFGPIENHVGNHLFVPSIGVSYPVNTYEKTNPYSADLDFVYARAIKMIPNTSLILKLGAGYEHMTSKLTNTTIGVPNQFAASQTITTDGMGVTGGVGMQYAFTKHVAARVEVDGLKGKSGIGYAQGLMGLVLTF